MAELLSSDHVPEPQGGRDVESQRIYDALQSRIFGVDGGPTMIGRWRLGERIGRGAMGTVYEAYDPKLERRVAIKVLHPMSPEVGAVRRIRLQREAQAMARLRHAGLVEVYDVFPDEPQPYVVMELVTGVTLRAWQDAATRSWRALVEVYLEAARSLAALHAVGLVHRDFKPDNAMIDGHGRVRVVDLGLVFAEQLDEPQGPTPPTLTRDGLLVGTLSYMSPEQLEGGQSDAHSDQFGLCAALYEAVHGARPYAGGDPEALLADMRANLPPLRPNPRGAPRWLGLVLRRGLALRPERRFRDMDALIAALERGLARRRRLVAGMCVAAVAAAASVAAARTFVRPPDPCTSLDGELDGAWDESQQPALRAAFLAGELPHAEREWSHLSSAIRTSRDRWLRLRRAVCPELREVNPAPSVVARARCLDDVRLFMQRLTATYLAASTVHVLHAREAAAELAARVRQCSQITPAAPAPARPALAVPIQAALIEAEAEQATGGLARAEAAARTAVALAEEADLDLARAESRHRLGRILGHRRRADEALDLLRAAAGAARRAGHRETAIDAELFAAKVQVLERGTSEGLADTLAEIEDDLVGLHRAGLDVRTRSAELLEVRGFAARLRGELPAAGEHFADALRLHGAPAVTAWTRPCPGAPHVEVPASLADEPGNPLDLVRGLNNLALVLGEQAEHRACTESIYADALALADAHLGPLHPVSIDVRFDYAEHLGRQRRTAEQVALLRPVEDASALQFGEDSVPVADVLLSLATIAGERDDLDGADERIRRAIDLYAARCDDAACPANYGPALLARAEVLMLRDRREQAVPAYEAACVQLARRGETAAEHVGCLYYLAETLTALGRGDAARAALAAAEPHFRRLRSPDESIVELRRRLHDNNQPKENEHAAADRE